MSNPASSATVSTDQERADAYKFLVARLDREGLDSVPSSLITAAAWTAPIFHQSDLQDHLRHLREKHGPGFEGWLREQTGDLS